MLDPITALILGGSFVLGCWLLTRRPLVDLSALERVSSTWLNVVQPEDPPEEVDPCREIEDWINARALDENHANHLRYSYRVVAGIDRGDVAEERLRLVTNGAPLPA